MWDYYHRFAGRGDLVYELFDRWGNLVVDVVLDRAYSEVSDKIFMAFHHADESVIEALTDNNLRREPLFVKLLKRNLPDHILAEALRRLGDNPAEVPRLLADWDNLSDSTLIEALGPPPEGMQTWVPGYGVYYYLRKVAQGRETDTTDLIWAALDIPDVALTVVTIGAGSGLAKVGRTLAKGVEKGVAKNLAQRGAKPLSKKIIGETLELAGRATARDLAPSVLREAYASYRTTLVHVKEFGQIDVTEFYRFMYSSFRKVGLGGRTFKRLTGGEPRIFMRSDRRVVIYPGDLLDEKTVLGRLLRESAINAGFDITLRSPPGRAAVGAMVGAVGQGTEVGEEHLAAWREYASLWWLAVHTGRLDSANHNSAVPEDHPPKVGD